MFWTRSDVAELRKQNATLRQDRDDAWESANNLSQQANEASLAMKRMQLPYTEEGLEEIALATARRIEDLFITSPGGRDHRLMQLKNILREVMRANLTGNTNWKGPGEPNYKTIEEGEL